MPRLLYLFNLLVQFLTFTHFSVYAKLIPPSPAPTPTHPHTHTPTPTPTLTPWVPLPPPLAPPLPPKPDAPPPLAPRSDHKQETPPESEGSSGLSGGQKAGIVIGVFAAAGVVGAGGMVYKKRRSNIRRARFGYDARRDTRL